MPAGCNIVVSTCEVTLIKTRLRSFHRQTVRLRLKQSCNTYPGTQHNFHRPTRLKRSRDNKLIFENNTYLLHRTEEVPQPFFKTCLELPTLTERLRALDENKDSTTFVLINSCYFHPWRNKLYIGT